MEVEKRDYEGAKPPIKARLILTHFAAHGGGEGKREKEGKAHGTTI